MSIVYCLSSNSRNPRVISLKNWSTTGHILDLYCVQLSNAAPFCQNYTKLYFDAKHLENGLNRGEGRRKFLVPFFPESAFFS